MKKLNDIVYNFSDKLKKLYVSPSEKNPEQEAANFRTFIDDPSIQINLLSDYRVGDLSNALERLHTFMLNFEARDANEDAVDEKYVPSYNAALLISMLKKTFFPNSKLNPKLIDTYRTFEAASNPRVGDIVDAIATDLMNTDKRYLKYASLHEGLQGVLYNQYISRVSKKKPENALLAFGDALRELGITGILEIKLNDALASIPSAKALAEAKGAPAKSSSLKVAGKEELALLYFIDLYNIISKGTGAIFKSGTMFRLPREIVKNQIKAMPNGLIDSDKTVGDVVDIWNMSIQEYVDANTSRLTGLQRSAALLALLGAGYLFVRYRD